uniref:intraflagellar transport protein 88 homolog isoform X2 n=1 Tax=Myxine glutinosa TaxID=7769 RepID=UPI00358E98C6
MVHQNGITLFCNLRQAGPEMSLHLRDERVMLAIDDQDADLYSGFNEYNPTFDIQELENDPVIQQTLRSRNGRRPSQLTVKSPTSTTPSRLGGSSLGTWSRLGSSFGARPVTGAGQDGRTSARPMTGLQAAGYTSQTGSGVLSDPLAHVRSPSQVSENEKNETTKGQIKHFEKKVIELVEESCFAKSQGDLHLALEKAKEAGRRERALQRQRENMGSAPISLDLTFSVLFNLAYQYEANGMYSEALNGYQVIVKEKMFPNAGRLKVNVANTYLKQKKYAKALKFYRMALDQVRSSQKMIRIKIMQNIGMVFVMIGKHTEAIASFEHIMAEKPNLRSAFNLALCYHAVGNQERTRNTFQRLVSIPLEIDEEKYSAQSDDSQLNLVMDAIKNDRMRQRERARRAMAERFIVTAARLIAPAIGSSLADGYDWCVEMLRGSQYMELVNDLEINKAVAILKHGDCEQAVEILKSIEKKDTRVKSVAATNLSFFYFLRNDLSSAERYADTAMNTDRYNPMALVNKGSCVMVGGDAVRAAEFFGEALRNDSSCTNALYNLGLVHKKQGNFQDALQCFLKLNAILRNDTQVMYQLASTLEALGEGAHAITWLVQLLGITPSDPHVLAWLGEMYDRDGDKSQALHHFFESYRYFPAHMPVIEWLGASYINCQFYEEAIQYFERAAFIQPHQVKWYLMIASSHRRSGNYHAALQMYRFIDTKFPDNVECLRLLVRLCKDLGLPEVQQYSNKLKNAERALELRQKEVTLRMGSGRRTTESGANGDFFQGGSVQNDRSPALQEEPPQNRFNMTVDSKYIDPLGPQQDRPRTAAKNLQVDNFTDDDDDIGEDLLPD